MLKLLNYILPAQTSCEQREQAVESFRNLRQQIPLLYGAAVVNLVGLHIATIGDDIFVLSPNIVLAGILIWRMLGWLFLQKPSDDFEVVASKLVSALVFTILMCIGFSLWTQFLINWHPQETMSILLFSLLAALGAAYGLSSFPRLAMLPLAILGMPMAVRLLLTGDATTKGVGVSLFIVLLLLMRLLHTHGGALTELVTSKLAVARERNRAISAEVAALKKASEDGLTGLVNRAKLFREIEKTMVQGPASGGGSVVAISDLDGFKAANDAFGHAAGDAILKTFARRLLDTFGKDAIVARTGGDEFVIFWRDGLPFHDIEAAGAKICELASLPIEWECKQLLIGASCGITEAGPLSTSASEFLRQADSALYRAKAVGRGAWKFYDLELLKSDHRRAGLEHILLNRETHDELTVHFQPIICLNTDQMAYAEALARWDSELLGHIPPSEFISVAEHIGLISELNITLLRKTIRLAKAWPQDLRLSFNLSAMQISRQDTATQLLQLLDNEGFAPNRIMFEVTETALLADMARAKCELKTLREAGCLIALDDFGAGHASVSYMRDLEFDIVKLDGSLTANIQHSQRARQILLGLIDLCQATGAKCVTEHVETAQQLALVRAMGCDFAQGYLLGCPMPGIPVPSVLTQDDGPPAMKTA